MAKFSEYTIVIPAAATMNERRAANFLQQKIRLVCGKKIPIVTDATPAVPCEFAVGKTTRETADGISFARAVERLWEYEIRRAGDRIYLTGFGLIDPTPKPYTSAYRFYNDGAYGTVFAVYHFTEHALECDFINDAFDEFEDDPDRAVPADCDFAFTKERLAAELPADIKGASIHTIPTCNNLDWNMTCFILRTKSGKLVVIDGGFAADTDHVLRSIEALSPGKKPVISAWLFSHLHADHYGVYLTLCTNPEFASRVTVENFYCHLLPEEFYTTLSKERNPVYPTVRAALLGSGETLGATVHQVQTGDVIRVDELEFEVLHIPSMEYATKMNTNDSSVVYRLTYDKKQTILFLADSEFVCNNDLMENHRDKLKSDVAQVGHHGCGNVSKECYAAIDAKRWLFQTGERFWYGDDGEGLNTHNVGVIRTRCYLRDIGVTPDRIDCDMNGIISLPLPIPTK